MNRTDPGDYPEPAAGGGIWRRWSGSRRLGLAALLVAANFSCQIVVYLLGGGLFLPVLAGAVCGVLLPVAWLVRTGAVVLPGDLSLTRPPLRVLLASAAAAPAAMVPTSLLARLSLRLHPADPLWVRQFSEQLPHGPAAIAVAAVAVVLAAPLAEEIIFRGLLHRQAARTWGAAAAAAISSLVFAIIHAQPWFLFGLIGIGLVLAGVYQATRSLIACSVTHAVHNGISLGLMLAAGSALPEDAPLTWADALWCALSLASLAFLWRVLAGGRAAAPDESRP